MQFISYKIICAIYMYMRIVYRFHEQNDVVMLELNIFSEL